jgi:diacylglycerol kinase (ATP)
MRACIIFNPTAGGDKARRLLRRLQQLESRCALRPTLAAGAARQLACEAVTEGFDTVVAAGGDGTVNEVLNGIADAPLGLDRTQLGVMPLGTANVFALELQMPWDPNECWDVIARGRTTSIDLPEIRFGSGNTQQRRFFIQMAGFGYDARVVSLVDWKLKKSLGKFAFVIAGFKALRNKLDMMTVSDGTHSYSGQLALLGNGKLYAGTFRMFHRADLCDGKFDVCVFPKVDLLVLLRCACSCLWPRMLVPGPQHYFQTESLTIEGPASTLLEIDGELAQGLPAACRMRPGQLRVIVP